ncbi:hypothetical protein Tco_0734837 [Tanacetum coccineum]
MTLAASTSTDKFLKAFDELMSTPIDFSGNAIRLFQKASIGKILRRDYPFDLFQNPSFDHRGKTSKSYIQFEVLSSTMISSILKDEYRL